MNSRRYFYYALLVLATLNLNSRCLAAEVFVSEQFGFRFSVPEGFHEQTDEAPMKLADGTPMTVAMFAKDSPEGDFSIAIYIQRLGQIVLPNERLDLEKLPKQEAIRLSLELRRWQKLELQVVKQEATLGPSMDMVGYLIQFPLKDEGIQIRVQGPQSRSDEVLKAFDMAVHGFENTKTYITKVVPVGGLRDSTQGYRLILALLSALVVGVLFIVAASWFTKGVRPIGVVFVAFLGLASGVFIAGQNFLELHEIYSDSTGPVSVSNAFAVNMTGSVLFSLIAIVAFFGLIIGAKWGWWLGIAFWTWRLSRQVLMPITKWLFTGRLADVSGSIIPDQNGLFRDAVVFGLILAYLYKDSVVVFFRVNYSSKLKLALRASGAFIFLSGLFHLLIAQIML